MRRWLLLPMVGLLAGAAVAEPGFLRLTELAAGTEWIGWQEAGLLQIPAPEGWSIEGTPEDPLTVQLVGGELVTLPPETALRAEGAPMLGFQASWVKVVHRRGSLAAMVDARRVMLPGGALMRAEHPSFGPAALAMVAAVYTPRRRPFQLTYTQPLAARFDRLEVLCPADEPARVESLRLPAVAEAGPETLRRVGIWSPAGVRVEVTAETLTAQTERVEWAQLEDQVLRTEPVRLQSPRADVSIRRATFRAVSRRTLPCRLTEPAGLMAENLRLEVSGAPAVVAFSSADGVDGLEVALEAVAGQRTGGAGRGTDPLIEAVREFLLPLWYGLWYDAELGREVVRKPATLRSFCETYRAARQASEADLRNWLTGPGRRYTATSLADQDAFATALGELVDSVSRQDRKAGVWWSVYLSDLLTTLAGAPVYYWQPDVTLKSAAAQPGEVTFEALAEAAQGRRTALLAACEAQVEASTRAEALVFPRLDPAARLPVELILEVGRRTPVGVYQAEIVLSGAGEARVPLTVRVKPSYGEVGLLALVILIPLALALAAAGLLVRRKASVAGG